jgi:DNA-directed RNA polymerase specialized sigma24 family protein
MTTPLPPSDIKIATKIARRAALVLRQNYPSYARDDAAQTAVAAILELHARTGTTDQAHWYNTARNAVVDELRKLQPRRSVNTNTEDRAQTTPPADALIRNRLRELPPDERAAVISVVMWETSPHDFAALSGVSVTTVRGRVTRGLSRLRALL